MLGGPGLGRGGTPLPSWRGFGTIWKAKQQPRAEQSTPAFLAGDVPELAKHPLSPPAPSFPVGNSQPSRDGGWLPWLAERGAGSAGLDVSLASDCLVVFPSLTSPDLCYLELMGHQAD